MKEKDKERERERYLGSFFGTIWNTSKVVVGRGKLDLFVFGLKQIGRDLFILHQLVPSMQRW